MDKILGLKGSLIEEILTVLNGRNFTYPIYQVTGDEEFLGSASLLMRATFTVLKKYEAATEKMIKDFEDSGEDITTEEEDAFYSSIDYNLALNRFSGARSLLESLVFERHIDKLGGQPVKRVVISNDFKVWAVPFLYDDFPKIIPINSIEELQDLFFGENPKPENDPKERIH